MSSLTQSQLEFFDDKGFLKVNDLLEIKHVQKIQDEIWEELADEFGINKHDSKTWMTPLHSPKAAKYSETNRSLINEEFRSIISSLLGTNNWKEPNSWGGFLINFPDKKSQVWNLADKLWHWDYELFRQPELGGLLIFSFYSEVQPQGGGTLIVSGSHRCLGSFYDSLTPEQKSMKHGFHRKHFMRSHPYFKKLTDPKLKYTEHIEWFMSKETIVDQVPLQVIELTGKPGDVVFCHPRLIHAPASINISEYPRMMRTKFLW